MPLFILGFPRLAWHFAAPARCPSPTLIDQTPPTARCAGGAAASGVGCSISLSAVFTEGVAVDGSSQTAASTLFIAAVTLAGVLLVIH